MAGTRMMGESIVSPSRVLGLLPPPLREGGQAPGSLAASKKHPHPQPLPAGGGEFAFGVTANRLERLECAGSRRHRINRLRRRKRGREDHLDVVALHLRVD